MLGFIFHFLSISGKYLICLKLLSKCVICGFRRISLKIYTFQVQGLKKELGNTQKTRKAASVALRDALQKAAQLRLMEKEKNKSPSYAMRISLKINKVVWGMLVDGKPFAEAEINNMVSVGQFSFFLSFSLLLFSAMPGNF